MGSWDATELAQLPWPPGLTFWSHAPRMGRLPEGREAVWVWTGTALVRLLIQVRPFRIVTPDEPEDNMTPDESKDQEMLL